MKWRKKKPCEFCGDSLIEIATLRAENKQLMKALEAHAVALTAAHKVIMVSNK